MLEPNSFLLEGSLYTDKGIIMGPSSSLHILGNWVTNVFERDKIAGTLVVDYISSRTRTDVGSLHPTRGKYNPKRYNISFSPVWSTWRAY